MGRGHRGLFGKIEVVWWLTNPRRTCLSRAHSADYLWLVLQSVAQGSELVCCWPTTLKLLARDWGVKRHTVSRSLAVLSRGPAPLIEIISDHEIWVCDISKVCRNPITGDSVVAPYLRDQDQDQEREEERDQEPEAVAHTGGSKVNTEEAQTTATAPPMEREHELAKAALKEATSGWKLRGDAMLKVATIIHVRPKEVLAYAREIQQNPKGIGSPWSVLVHRLTAESKPGVEGHDPPADCVKWAASKLRYD